MGYRRFSRTAGHKIPSRTIRKAERSNDRAAVGIKEKKHAFVKVCEKKTRFFTIIND